MIKILQIILNTLYPRHCPVCHRILKDQRKMVCPECLNKVPLIGEPFCKKCGRPVGETEEYCGDCRRIKHDFTEGRGILRYDAVMKESMIRYKYHGCREYGNFYAAVMCRAAEKEILRWKPDVIVPVPLHRSKEKMRGFNQAEYLAGKIGHFWGIPTAPGILRKTQKTKSQKKLNADERRRNLKKAFSVSQRLDGMDVLVVDDVYTTGSTMDAAAECLRENGAENVYFLTVCIGQN